MADLRNKKILILGAGTWQVPWLQRAREMGMQVFATDWEADPEGRKYADVFAQIDLKDKDKSLEFAKQHQVEAVFTSADIGVQTAAHIAQKMGLNYHSPEVAFQCTNKHAMRQRAGEIGLGIPAFFQTEELDEAIKVATEIGYPVIIKPVDNFSSRGVSVLENEEELRQFFNTSKAASFSGKVLVEEFMRGTEGSVEALVSNGKAHIMGVCDKIKSALPYRYDLQLNYPGNFSEQQYAAIENFIEKLVNGYGIKNGIIHVEIMVHENSVKLIEFAIRGCGSKVVTHLMPETRGFDVISWLLEGSFGENAEIKFTANKYGVLKFIMLPAGTISKLEGVEKAKSVKGILDCAIERKVGDQLGVVADGRSRPGYILAAAESKEELDAVLNEALECLDILIEA